MKTKTKRNNAKGIVILSVLLLIYVSVILIFLISIFEQEGEPSVVTNMNALLKNTTPYKGTLCEDEHLSNDKSIIETFAMQHNLTVSDWPDSLIELMEKNPETTDFVLNYPLKKYLSPDIDLNEYINCSEVPLFLQWDERWGYLKYGDDMIGLSGCGPTCLSMVCMYILDDPQYSPRYVAEFAQKNGYCIPGNGSSWTLISEGGEKLGLDVIEIPLDENRIIRNLEAGNPIICVMGPGDFTSSGHYIVMTGYVDGKIKVNDPNSLTRSNMLWEYNAIKDQIRNLWVCC